MSCNKKPLTVKAPKMQISFCVVGKGRAIVFRSLDDHDVHATGARFDGIRVADASPS